MRGKSWNDNCNKYIVYLTVDPPTERTKKVMYFANAFINVGINSHNLSMKGVCLFFHWWVYKSHKVSRNSSQKTGDS